MFLAKETILLFLWLGIFSFGKGVLTITGVRNYGEVCAHRTVVKSLDQEICTLPPTNSVT